MTLTTENYCSQLHKLDLETAIRAIHQAYCQLKAHEAGLENLDNKQAIADLEECLRQAGHLGFGPPVLRHGTCVWACCGNPVGQGHNASCVFSATGGAR